VLIEQLDERVFVAFPRGLQQFLLACLFHALASVLPTRAEK
jgi:hypothetical protein